MKLCQTMNPLPRKKNLKAKCFEEDWFMRLKVRANCDFVFAARGNFSYTHFGKGTIVDNKRMPLLSLILPTHAPYIYKNTLETH